MLEQQAATTLPRHWVPRAEAGPRRASTAGGGFGLVLLEAVLRYRGGDELGALDCLGRLAVEPLDTLSCALEPLSPVRSSGCGQSNGASGTVRDAQAQRRISLTPTQRKILREVAWGAANPQIATALGISVNTVKWHLKQVFVCLGVTNRCAAVTMARAHGLL